MIAVSFTITTVYLSGLWAGLLRRAKSSRRLRRTPLALCLILNFGLLAFLKYNSYLMPSLGLLLIPGISFYTFQAAGYLIDVYKGKVEADRNPFKIALFLSFFPLLVQGPISRHNEISGDLCSGHGWDWERSRKGMQRIIWGYFMKLIIADHAAPIVSTILADYSSFGGAIIVFGMLMFSIQIYADFAGGINIAIGIAEIVGVKLPENFRQPFFAISLADFWRRWHITLGAWLKDYLFFPLAISTPLAKLGRLSRKLFGARAGKIFPASLATFCVYIVVGVWHGSGMHLFFFGFMNGLIISSTLFAEPWLEKLRKKTGISGNRPGFGRAFAIVRTFALLGILRYFVAAGSLRDALRMIRHTVFSPRFAELMNGQLLQLGIDGVGLIILCAGTAALLVCDYITERGVDCGEMLNSAHPAIQFSLLMAAFLSIVLFSFYSDNAVSANFIYAGV